MLVDAEEVLKEVYKPNAESTRDKDNGDGSE